MKISTLALLVAVVNAAPVIITRTHTAPAVTVWATANIPTGTKTSIVTTSAAPPANSAPALGGQAPAPPAPAPPAEETTTEAAPTTPTTTEAAPTTPTTTEAAPTTPTTTEAAPTTPTTTEAAPTTPTTPTTTNTPTTSSTPAPQPPTTLTTSSSTSTTPTTSTTSPTDSLNSFEAQILATHNEKRALHGVPDLTWDPVLAEYAANYAAKSFSCDNVQLIHSGGPYGENLAAGYVGGADPVTAWYDEISQYDFSNPGFTEATGHFTQVVWKSSSTLGCAKVSCGNAWRQYTICEYSKQRGNVVGTDSSTGKSYFEENVLPPL
ncbi:repressed by EFG1 protein 1 [[Candida] anglica]|uniref:Repressed by EFG1 protein 1 n=1 Tax=[Candida] anglica TaxID=148631 RepID=A0ABP0EGV1_9ASCO